MAQRRTTDESVTQATGVILSEVDRLDAIIERLLNFSRPIRLTLTRVEFIGIVPIGDSALASEKPADTLCFSRVTKLFRFQPTLCDLSRC